MLFNSEELKEASSRLYKTMHEFEGKVKIPFLPGLGIHPEFVASEIVKTRKDLAEQFIVLQSSYAVINAILSRLGEFIGKDGVNNIMKEAANSIIEFEQAYRIKNEKEREEAAKPKIELPNGPFNNG